MKIVDTGRRLDVLKNGAGKNLPNNLYYFSIFILCYIL